MYFGGFAVLLCSYKFSCTLEFYERTCLLLFLLLSSSISCEEMEDYNFLRLLLKIHASDLAVSWFCVLDNELFKRRMQALSQVGHGLNPGSVRYELGDFRTVS